ncbi:hypothetical protein ABW636_00380 [Aquimarina sp. 2201CG1-2-11]|uniref:hypothetical protein n=1 Tax=Aquimarina discodermiae TaxID=3231043 RepID=UPI0034629EF0
MSFSIIYKPLFELHIFHNYFLGLGEEEYDHTQKPDVFDTYNAQDFVVIVPKAQTQKILRNHKISIKPTSTGLMGFISVDENAEPVINSEGLNLEFLIYIKDSLFEKYTKLNTNNTQIFYFKSDKNAGKYRLDKLNAKNASPINDFSVPYDSDENSEYQQLLKDIAIKDRMSLFGIVSLDIEDLLSGQKVPNATKEFKIVFKSKKAFWVYLDEEDQEVYRTSEKLPLIKKGTIEVIDDDSVIYRMATPRDMDLAGEARIYV